MTNFSLTDRQLNPRERHYMLWASFIVVALSIGFIYGNVLLNLLKNWVDKPEYNHGFLIVFISVFILWQRKNKLKSIELNGSWAGVLVVAIAIALFIIGKFSFSFLLHYSIIVLMVGVGISLLGWNGFRIISLPILLLLFTVPLPHGVFLSLSGELQLLSSKVGVYLIEALGISVYQEGNIIELGTYKLQVEEACSGLRYLYPLMSLSFVTAYFLRTSFWIRLFVFLSSIPLAIIMNGIRLGLTGLLVEYKGADIAEGFLHYFEGWLIFLFSITILFFEVWVFARIFYHKSLRDVLMIELPTTSKGSSYNSNIFRSKPFTFVVFVLAISAIFRVCLSMPDLQEKIYPETHPYKMDFSSFPLELGEWQGIRGELKKWEIEMLKPTEYIIADYRNNANEVVNLYAGFWASKQRGGPHRPEVCLTGGGWQILEVSKIAIKGVSFTEKAINVNRLRIEKGGDIRLVYYWYQLENKHFQSNTRLWWHQKWERLIKGPQQKNLTMIRLMTPVGFSYNSASADIRLSMFAKELFRAFNNNMFIHCSRAEIKSTNLSNNYN